MLRSVSWNRSSIRIAPLVPRIVRIKNSSNPLVCAWVTIKKPTPTTMPVRLIAIDRFRATRNLTAILRFGLIRMRVWPSFLFSLRGFGHDPPIEADQNCW